METVYDGVVSQQLICNYVQRYVNVQITLVLLIPPSLLSPLRVIPLEGVSHLWKLTLRLFGQMLQLGSEKRFINSLN